MKSLFYIAILIVLLHSNTMAQNVGIGDSSDFIPDSSSVFELRSTQRGFLAPRMTKVQRQAITSPAKGLIVYQTDDLPNDGIYYFDGSLWIRLAASAGSSQAAWLYTGNSGLASDGSNFIGTLDAVPLIFKTQNTERMRLSSSGNLGVNNNNPTNPLDIIGNTQIQNGNLLLSNNNGSSNSLFFYEPSGSGTNFTSITAQAQATDINYIMPSSQGAASSILTNDGTGILSWTSGSNIAWALTGNSGTNAANNFAGTSDAVDFVLRANNSERLRLLSSGNSYFTGNLGVNTNPLAGNALTVSGNSTITNGNVNLTNSTNTANTVYFYEPSGSGNNYIAFKARPMANNVNLQWPDSAGKANACLSTDATGNLYWQSVQQLTSNIRYNVLKVVTDPVYNADTLDTHILMGYNGDAKVILPSGSSLAGKQYFIKRLGGGNTQVNVCPSGGATIDGSNYIRVSNQYSSVMIVYDGSNWFIMSTYGNVSGQSGSCP